MNTKILNLKHIVQLIEKRLSEDYGDEEKGDAIGWRHAVKIKPPYKTLKSTLECISKHWMASFSFVFKRSADCYVSELIAGCQQWEQQSLQSFSLILEPALALFNLISPVWNHDPVVAQCKQVLLVSDFLLNCCFSFFGKFKIIWEYYVLEI